MEQTNEGRVDVTSERAVLGPPGFALGETAEAAVST